MYSVYVGNTCIYDDTSTEKSLRLINPVLELADSAAGSFKMTVPVTNVGYTLINRMTSDISVRKDGEEMWMGRVIDESIDFWKNRTLTCEGELAFLNDSIQPPAEYHDQTVRGFLETLIGIHNSKVPADRRFTVGAVTVTDPNDSLYRYTNYEKTIECINDKLIDRLGGHLIIRKENGVRYLDYLADKLSTNTQTIEFGTNLLDYAASYDMTEFATVLVPLGERLDESPIAALEAYLTVASVNNGSIYVQNAEAVQNYGWIEKVVHFDRVTVASNLLSKAQQYLSSIQFNSMVLEVKAIDLHYLNPEIEGVKLSDQIRVVSPPHGLDKIFPVMKLSIPLDHPENTQFTLGTKVTTTLTAANNKVNSEILQQIESIPTKQSVLEEAQENAQEIMDLISNGFITITTNQNGSQELFIADNQDLLQATRFWRWNVNGLAYGTKTAGAAISTATYSIAMTMDGSIVADRITTGTLRADLLTALKVKASTLTIVNESDPSQAGETLASVIQRFEVSDGQLSSEISGLSQVAVKTVEVYYALGDSQITAPSTGWSTTAPAWESGKYMWQKTLTIFADDGLPDSEHPGQTITHRSWSNPTCIQGAVGQTGDTGVGISSVVPEYYLSTSASTQSGGSWSTTCPAWQSGKYIWTRSHVYYDNNTDSTTTPVLDNAVNGLGQNYTQIKQTMDSLTLTASSTSTTDNIEVDAGRMLEVRISPEDDSTSYMFEKDVNGDYISQNAGVANSFSYGIVVFNFTEQTTVRLRCTCYGETNYDFGVIGDLDVLLEATRSEDASGVKYSFKNNASSGTTVDLDYTVPSGSHQIRFKYVKDSSTDPFGDYLKVHVYKLESVVTGATSTITLSGTGITAQSANIDLTGVVTFSDLLTAGRTIINGANIQTGTVSADRIKTNEVWYGDHKIIAGTTKTSSLTPGGTTSSLIEIQNGIKDEDGTLGDIMVKNYATSTMFAEPGDTTGDDTLAINPAQKIVLPGSNGDWWLGDRYNYFGRLYLGDRAYLWVDSNGELNFTYRNNTYTLAPNI